MSTHGRVDLYRLSLLTACLCWVHALATAQPFGAAALARANQGPDLKFPEEAKELSVFSPLTMAIYRPAGARLSLRQAGYAGLRRTHVRVPRQTPQSRQVAHDPI